MQWDSEESACWKWKEETNVCWHRPEVDKVDGLDYLEQCYGNRKTSAGGQTIARREAFVFVECSSRKVRTLRRKYQVKNVDVRKGDWSQELCRVVWNAWKHC